MTLFATPRQLRQRGILGMNQRNADFIMRYNPRHLFPLVDNKLITKKLALKYDIAVPELYAAVEIEKHVRRIEDTLADYSSLVIKPAHGSGGNGILVINGRMGKFYRKASGDLISLEMIQHHTSNILSGMYSLGGVPDKALLEYRVEFDPFFENIAYQGVPDIRVIVFRGIPVAAMVRLPTRDSDGKANLHQGAVGVGIGLADGISSYGVCRDQLVDQHPDTGCTVTGIVIPHWDRILELATNCASMVGLGYLGVDLVMDRDLGPLMLELNARPGLSIQLANGRGLLTILRNIEAFKNLPDDIGSRIELAKDMAVRHQQLPAGTRTAL